MTANDWSVVVAVVAVVVAGGSAVYTVRHSRRLASSGFKTAEDLKVDLVALLAALRSAIYKGIAASQDNKPRDVSVELERIRAFQASPSGYALAALAAERGSGSDRAAGRWRVLGLQFAELGGAVSDPHQSDGAVTLEMRHWATEIETTLSTVTLQDVDWMALKIGDLRSMITSVVETRDKDMVARIWFELAEQRRRESDPQSQLDELRTLEASGVDDPNIVFWIAMLTDDLDLLEKALAAGADRSLTANQVIKRHTETPRR